MEHKLIRRILATTKAPVKAMDVLTALQRIDSSIVHSAGNLLEPDSQLIELVDEVRDFLNSASQTQGTSKDRWQEEDLSRSHPDPVFALDSSPWEEGNWNEDELEWVVLVFPHVENSIHENNPLVQQLANALGRKTRSVESQLLMCRKLQKDNEYSWGNMNRLIPGIWERRNEIWEHGLFGICPDGTIDSDYVPDTPGDTPTTEEPTHAEAEEDPPATAPPQPGAPFAPGDRVAWNNGVLNGTVSRVGNNDTVEVTLDDGETTIFNCSTLTRVVQRDEIADVPSGEPTGEPFIETPGNTDTKLDDNVVDPPPGPPGSSNDGHDETGPFSRLLERAFGGQDVAISPAEDMDPFWPVGPSAVGTTDVCQRLIDHLGSATSEDAAEWVFLVGGAGNGKSFLANRVVKEVGCELTSDVREGLADRVYLYRTAANRTFRLVNDATIPPESRGAGSPPHLCLDLNEAIDHGQDLLACVNRGILIGERDELDEPHAALGDQQALLARLIQWLIDPIHPATPGSDETTGPFQLRLAGEEDDQHAGPLDGYYAQAELLSSGSVVAHIHLLNMDYASLFEPDPLEDGRSLRWDAETGRVAVTRYGMLSHRRDKARRQESPAFQVISSLVEKFDAIDVNQDSDPLLANLSMMRNEGIRESLVEILRSVEIVTGHRFTYRELWGVLCIALVGYVRPEFRTTSEDAVAPRDWHQQQISGLQENGDELFAFVNAAMQRSHMSLFGGRVPDLKAWRNWDRFEPSFPSASRWVKEIDPATDAVPEWAEVVHQGMMSIQISENQRPSQYLIDHEPSFEASWHSFDNRLEELVLAKIQHEKTSDPDRRLLQSWYGSYLLRLYGLALGIPAFSSTIHEWTENWKAAQAGHSLTVRFQAGLITLLTGKSSSNQQSVYLPWLAPRTTPLRDSSSPTIVTEFREQQFWNFGMSTRGDTLSLSLQEPGAVNRNQAHEIIVDFSLCRDALCCSSGSLGFTDQSHKTAPRLERMRAALMSEAHVREPGQAIQRPRHGALVGDRFVPFE